MLGALVGDVLGSVYERGKFLPRSSPLPALGARFTDDTVFTLATAEAVLLDQLADPLIAQKKPQVVAPNSSSAYAASIYPEHLEVKTHTIRHNRTRTSHILTFTPAFEKQLLAAHPWATAVLMHALLKYCVATLDQEQLVRMKAAASTVPDRTYHQLKALTWLQNGFRLMDTTLEEGLVILNEVAHTLLPMVSATPTNKKDTS